MLVGYKVVDPKSTLATPATNQPPESPHPGLGCDCNDCRATLLAEQIADIEAEDPPHLR
jgi:hypothetical protein